jgi:hypothetical protein
MTTPHISSSLSSSSPISARSCGSEARRKGDCNASTAVGPTQKKKRGGGEFKGVRSFEINESRAKSYRVEPRRVRLVCIPRNEHAPLAALLVEGVLPRGLDALLEHVIIGRERQLGRRREIVDEAPEILDRAKRVDLLQLVLPVLAGLGRVVPGNGRGQKDQAKGVRYKKKKNGARSGGTRSAWAMRQLRHRMETRAPSESVV